MDDLSLDQLRLLVLVAEHGSFTDAAIEARTTQSTVSRRVAAAERAFGAQLFERGAGGVRPTAQGRVALRRAEQAIDALDGARRELAAHAVAPPALRIGAFALAGFTLLPDAVVALQQRHELRVTTREGPTPRLVRMLRAGTIDLAVVTTRPPHRPADDELPSLVVETLVETSLRIAVATRGPLGDRTSAPVEAVSSLPWIAPAEGDAPALGLWPGLPGPSQVRFRTSDWAVRLTMVAAGLGVTAVPWLPPALLPAGITLLRVEGVPPEERRVSVARRPDIDLLLSPAVEAGLRALRVSARQLLP